MHLKRIELAGFKSFAKRTELDFRPGVTAVVGPNGSGKSNISDAVRWVLGEQSAKSLRGGKMEDVIFSGSEGENHRNIAEVTLVLDNRDEHLPLPYEEVSITRRVTRSGDSDYFINKKACRLKDVVDLFMDTGLSRDAFAIIGQGRVEQVISGKPEDRRTVIEEAAGVLKYRQRKKQAERKLQDTEQNLARVDDILYELAGRVEPLREQAALAQEYQVAKERHDELETGILGAEIRQLDEQLLTSERDLTLATNEVTEATEEATQLLQEQQHQEQALTDTRETFDREREQERFHSTEIERLQGELNLARAREEHGAEMKERLEKQWDTLTNERAEFALQRETVERDYTESRTRYEQLQGRERSLREALLHTSRNFQEEIDALQAEAFELATEQATLNNQRKRETRDLEQAQQAQKRLVDENRTRVEVRQTTTEQLEAAERDVRTQRERLERLQQEERGLTKQKAELATRRERALQSFHDLERRRQKTEDRIEFLERMKQSYEGYFHAVKFVLKERGDGVIGAVAELLSVKPEHAAALETALGQTQQHIVVRDEAVGRREIERLRKQAAGRATFIPMTTVRERQLPSEVLNQLQQLNGFVGVAADLVGTEATYDRLKRSLLGAVIVATNLVEANKIAKMIQYRYRVVTLDGDVVNVGGSMTGGSRKQGVALFTQSRELDELNTGLAQGLTMIREQKLRIETIEADIERCEQALRTVRSNCVEQEQLTQQAERAWQQVEREANTIHSQMELFDYELKRYTNVIDETTKEIERIDQRLAVAVQTERDIRERLQAVRLEQHDRDVSAEQLTDELRQVELAAQREQLTMERHHDELERLETHVARLTEQVERLEAERERFEQGKSISAEELERQLTEERNLLETLEANLEQTRADVVSREENLRILKHRIDHCLERKRRAEQKTRHHENMRHELELKRTWKLESLEERGLFFALLPEMEMDVEAAKEEFKLLVRQLEEIGPVNIGAIDEFVEVNERFTYLSEQRDDLVSAKDDLYEIIEEMDREVVRLFNETYKAVRGHFKETFVQLFGGGEADLKLVDDKDLLNTGIEIVAKPPGKKLQTLSLLSGGERSLTAIALLFAILKTRPVPFCVLDEVEAALDEANVHRFGEYVRTLAIDTQFVIITHRKGTMEAADILYGVTMQQNGVSEILSVELSEAKRVVELHKEMEEST